jgi:hypothetical protein
MRDDREIADLGGFCHVALDGSAAPWRQATVARDRKGRAEALTAGR